MAEAVGSAFSIVANGASFKTVRTSAGCRLRPNNHKQSFLRLTLTFLSLSFEIRVGEMLDGVVTGPDFRAITAMRSGFGAAFIVLPVWGKK